MAAAAIEEILLDLSSRFIINLPPEESSSFERLFFHVELAHWYYLDVVCEENASLPKMSFRVFTQKMFDTCPLLIPYRDKCQAATDEFIKYKHSVPTYGAVLVSADKKKILLVSGVKSKSFTFPGGKMNEGEKPAECAAREVYEEIGYDITKYITESNYIEIENADHRKAGLFVIPNVPLSTRFQAQTVNEIGRIEWHEVPTVFAEIRSTNRYYGVVPFARPLERTLKRLGVMTSYAGHGEPKSKGGSLGHSHGHHYGGHGGHHNGGHHNGGHHNGGHHSHNGHNGHSGQQRGGGGGALSKLLAKATEVGPVSPLQAASSSSQSALSLLFAKATEAGPLPPPSRPSSVPQSVLHDAGVMTSAASTPASLTSSPLLTPDMHGAYWTPSPTMWHAQAHNPMATAATYLHMAPMQQHVTQQQTAPHQWGTPPSEAPHMLSLLLGGDASAPPQ